MQFSRVVAFLAGASLVVASTIHLEERTFNNGVTFRGEIGGHAFEETGTVQEVWATLKARHPEIELTRRSDAPIVDKREKVLPPLCIPVGGQDWNFAEAAAIEDGVNYLYGLDTTLTNGPGPGNCGRVSCSYNSAIYWCNDNDFEFSVSSDYVADMTLDILHYCQHCIQPGNFCVTGGQEFEDTADFNVIVRSDSC